MVHYKAGQHSSMQRNGRVKSTWSLEGGSSSIADDLEQAKEKTQDWNSSSWTGNECGFEPYIVAGKGNYQWSFDILGPRASELRPVMGATMNVHAQRERQIARAARANAISLTERIPCLVSSLDMRGIILLSLCFFARRLTVFERNFFGPYLSPLPS